VRMSLIFPTESSDTDCLQSWCRDWRGSGSYPADISRPEEYRYAEGLVPRKSKLGMWVSAMSSPGHP